MTNKIRKIIIPKEEAVFWMDKAGCWRNEGGKFRNKKVIDYFHAAIGKDDDGYFVSHVRDDLLEKVYFRYEDTALFVFGVLLSEIITLVLNTGKQIPLNPGHLYIRDDNLYASINNESIKFSERAMIKLASFIIEDDGLMFLEWNGNIYKISEKQGDTMKNQDFEVRVMNYFAENMNLQKYWNIAKDCAKEIGRLRFKNIISGEFEMPTHVDMKKKASERIPYEFDASDFMQNGPIDFSGLDEGKVTETLHKIEALYKKFHEAQAMAVAKAAIKLIEKLVANVREELDQVKNKYLS